VGRVEKRVRGLVGERELVEVIPSETEREDGESEEVTARVGRAESASERFVAVFFRTAKNEIVSYFPWPVPRFADRDSRLVPGLEDFAKGYKPLRAVMLFSRLR
jgi:hypothetical protein